MSLLVKGDAGCSLASWLALGVPTSLPFPREAHGDSELRGSANALEDDGDGEGSAGLRSCCLAFDEEEGPLYRGGLAIEGS